MTASRKLNGTLLYRKVIHSRVRTLLLKTGLFLLQSYLLSVKNDVVRLKYCRFRFVNARPENQTNILYYIYYKVFMIHPQRWRPIRGSQG